MKTNARDILILETYATGLSAAFGAVGNYALSEIARTDLATGLAISVTWLIVHTPILVNLSWRLRSALGEREPASVTANSAGRGLRRIPWTAGQRTGAIFATLLPGSQAERTEAMVSFTVTNDGVDFEFDRTELHDILIIAWRRQRSGLNALARKYWLSEHRPRMKRQRYNALLILLSPLLADRGQKRSGRLLLPPLFALDYLGKH